MAKSKKIDFLLLFTTIILVLGGLLFLSSASSFSAEQNFNDPFYFLKHQLRNLGIGIVVFFICLKINLKKYKKYFFYVFLINLLLMLVVFIPQFQITSGDSARWFEIAGISVQPSEFLKLSFILYLAYWLSSTKKNNRIIKQKGEWVVLIVFLAIISIVGLILILQSDLSTLLLIVTVGIIMYFSSKYPFWHTVIAFSLIALLGWVFATYVPYRRERIELFFHPEKDPLGFGFQLQQAKIGVGSGGITGAGLGMSQQRFGILPQPLSDSIFVIIAEETGFVGAIILILLFLLFVWRGFKITKETSDNFLQLVSFGITSWIFVQAFINIAAIIGVIPLTGIPLPFISYGGSALVSELAGVGILLNISKEK